MKKIWKVLTRSHITWLCGHVMVLVICLGYVVYIYNTNILPDKIAKQTFLPTTCFLLIKKLATEGYWIEHYRADFLVSYNVKNVQYNRWVAGNGLDSSFAKSSANQKDILVRYDVGKTYPCWYDPAAPQIVFLAPRQDWLSTLPLFATLAISVVTLYYFSKTLLRVIKQRARRTRKKRQQRS